MKILVTGGAGFIGSHVADAYLAAGHKVVILDDLSGGKRSNLPPKAKFIKADIRDSRRIKLIFKAEKFDVVNSHAAQMSVPDSVKDPVYDASINVLGVLNLMQAGAENKLKKFIHVSSGGTVYGAPKKLPATEKFPILPESPYGITKAVGEDYGHFYAMQHKVRFTALRYANVYGPRQLPHGEAGVVAIFIQRLLTGQPCTIFGDGSIIRDYVYVGDVARASLAVLKKGDGKGYNIGTNKPTTVKQLFSSITKALGMLVNPAYGPPRAGDVQANYLSYALAKKELGWSPRVGLDEGIKHTVKFFKDGAKR